MSPTKRGVTYEPSIGMWTTARGAYFATKAEANAACKKYRARRKPARMPGPVMVIDPAEYAVMGDR